MNNWENISTASNSTQAGEAESSANDLSSLLNYPAIGRLFDGPNADALDDMRARFQRTNQDLERVIRQGSKEDAERAARAVKAVNVTLDFLNTLDQMRREQKA